MAYLPTFYFTSIPVQISLPKFVDLRMASRVIQVDTESATPISNVRTSICLTVVLVYYKDCCRISEKTTESVKTLLVTVDFYIFIFVIKL